MSMMMMMSFARSLKNKTNQPHLFLFLTSEKSAFSHLLPMSAKILSESTVTSQLWGVITYHNRIQK